MSWLLPVVTAFYPLMKSGHYYYSDIVGFYITDIIADMSHLETKTILIVSNLLLLLPFGVTICMCAAVVVKLTRCKNLSVDQSQSWWVGPPQSQVTRSVIDLTSQVSRSSHQRKSCPLETCTSKDTPSSSLSSGKSKIKVIKNYVRRKRYRPSRNTKIVVMIIGLYIICLLPGNFLNVYNMLDQLNVISSQASINAIVLRNDLLQIYLYLTLIFSILLFALNSCLNPFLYYLMSDKFSAQTLWNCLERISLKMGKI